MSSGAVGKFRSSFGSRQSISKSSGIPRLSMNQGIKKRSNQPGNSKSSSKLPRHSVSARSNGPGKTTTVTKTKPSDSGCGKVFQAKRTERKVLSNLSNSPVVNKKPEVSKQTKNAMFADQTEIEFEADPNSLATILKNEPLKVETLTKDRPSDMLFFPDGRPSLCRRVPIVRNSFADGRPSMSGPGRVLSTKKAPKLSTSKAQQTFLHQSVATSRHSLYSVVKGRYSQAPTSTTTSSKIQIGRQSLQQGRKTGKPNKIVSTLHPLPFKSPPAQRILSRRNEVRISASPALRIPCPVSSTPPAQRILKKERKPLIRWADENDQIVQDKLAVHLFQESPTTPKTNIKKEFPKTPVSILKSRKHAKRNSLTPPMVKKEKKPDREEECTIEIVSLHLLNEVVTVKKEVVTSPEVPNIATQTKITTPPQPVTQQSQRKLPVNSIGQQNSGKTKKVSPCGAVTKQKVDVAQKDNSATQQKVVDIDEVLNIMTRQISTVKRRSVQAEVLNIYQRVALQLKGEETIPEEVDDAMKKKSPNVTVHMTTDSDPPKNSTPVTSNGGGIQTPEQNQVIKLLTPENMNKLQQSFEETNKSLDELALKTEEIHREMHQLQLDKEKLKALRLQAKLKKEKFQSFATPVASVTNPGQAATSADDIFNLDKVVNVDLNNGKLEFRNNEESPILSARIEFTSKNSPEILTQKSSNSLNSNVSNRTLMSPNMVHEIPTPLSKDLCFVLTEDLRIKDVDANDGNMVKQPDTENSNKIFPPMKQSVTETEQDDIKPNKQVSDSFLLDNKNSKNISSVDCSNCTTNDSLLTDNNKILPLGGASGKVKPKNTLAASSSNSSTKIAGISVNSAVKTFCGIGTGNKTSFGSAPRTSTSPTFAQPTSSEITPDGSSVDSLDTPPLTATQTSADSDLCHATNVSKKTRSVLQSDFKTSNSLQTNSTNSKIENVQVLDSTTNFLKVCQASEFLFKKPTTPAKQLPVPDMTSTIECPKPVRLHPFQTPKPFRDLRAKYMGSSLYRESPKSKMKNQFAQALLDEEVALLTCRIVKPPSTVAHLKKTVDPVATSLCSGDETHFVPIVQTPISGKKNPQKIGNGSAFSAYSSIP